MNSERVGARQRVLDKQELVIQRYRTGAPLSGPTEEYGVTAGCLFVPGLVEGAVLEHGVQERRRAAAFATLGVDYPYAYDGAPFGADDFRASA